jgi:hypothetical protein
VVLRLLLPAVMAIPVLLAAPAAADAPAPTKGQVDALTIKVSQQGAVIHQLTEQLDQARLRVSSTSSRLVSVSRQHDATVQQLDANRTILLEQALRAYMHGGATPQTPSAAAAADLTLGREYLRVASGDLANTGDQLRLLEVNLRGDQTMLRNAEQASQQATVQLQALRTNALATAANQQHQLDLVQAQLLVKSQAAQAATAVSPGGGAGGATATPRSTTQGLPVNNGLLSVVQQAVALPVATPVVNAILTPPTTAAPAPATTTGGHAGGVWLALRRCESSDNYAENTGNGYYGAYQFSQSTWTGLGFAGRPDQESAALQDEAAMKLQAQSGWGQWPACASALGLI